MKIFGIIYLVVILSLSYVSISFSEVKPWDLDKAHSNIYFSIDHIFSKVNGNFNEFRTDIQFDSADLAGSKFHFEIQTESIDTNISKRDKHLQSADFFDAGKFSTMTFDSTEIIDKGNGVYDVNGKLSVKGKEYTLVLPLKLAGIKEHPTKKGTDVIGFNGKFEFDRLAHGIGSGKFYDKGLIGKDVEIFVSLELLSKR